MWQRNALRIFNSPVTHSNGNLNPAEREIKMNIKRSKNTNKFKNLGLAACAIMAVGVMTAGEAAAQCRLGGSSASRGYSFGQTAGFGSNSYRSNYASNNYNHPNSGYGNSYGNSHRNSYGLTSGNRGYVNQGPSLSLGLSYNRNVNSRYNTGYRNSTYSTRSFNNRLGSGNGYFGNSQQPVAYQHGNHIDVVSGHGRRHLTGRGN